MVTKPKQSIRTCKYAKGKLILQVQNLAKKLGRTPTKRDFDKDPDTASSGTAANLFGSWNKFLKAAGLEVNIKMGYIKEELIAQVQNLAKKLGRTPTRKDFDEDPDTASFMPAVRIFGSWNQFLKAAGLEVNIKMGYIKEELIAQVQNLAKKLGRTPTRKDFAEDPDTASSMPAVRIFGSWNQLLKEAGLEVNIKRDYTKEELISQVQNLAKKLGKTPAAKEFSKDPDTASFGTIVNLFGSWNQFLKEAGLEICFIRERRTKEELIAQVQNLAKKLGRTPTTADFNEDRRVAAVATIRNLFGSWNQFLKAAGLKPNKVFPNKR